MCTAPVECAVDEGSTDVHREVDGAAATIVRGAALEEGVRRIQCRVVDKMQRAARLIGT